MTDDARDLAMKKQELMQQNTNNGELFIKEKKAQGSEVEEQIKLWKEFVENRQKRAEQKATMEHAKAAVNEVHNMIIAGGAPAENDKVKYMPNVCNFDSCSKVAIEFPPVPPDGVNPNMFLYYYTDEAGIVSIMEGTECDIPKLATLERVSILHEE